MLAVLAAAAAFASRAAVVAKFDAMLASCTLPPAAIESIDDPNMRTLFRGVAAAAEQEEVRNAFSIVYQDLGPVRVAGDLIFGKLKRIAVDADRRVAGDEALQSTDAAALAAARSLFDAVDADASGGLTREELLASPVLLRVLADSNELVKTGSDGDAEALVDSFFSIADADGDGDISFVEFAHACASRSGRLRIAEEAISAALAEFEARGTAADGDGDAATRGGSSKRKRASRQSYGERFDTMLATCREWEEAFLCRDVADAATPEELDGCATPEAAAAAASQAQEEGNRLQQVLLGTFAGGRSEPVAAALRVCYETYSPLRVGGDLIFRVLKRLMASKHVAA